MYKILLVEDDILVSDLYHRVFTSKGSEVVTAVDGMDGLEKLKTFIPHIILLDLMMPRMNGLDMLDRIYTSDNLRFIPVFILSNISDPKKMEVCFEKGAKQFLVKSQVMPQEIFEMVEAYLRDTIKVNTSTT